MFFFYFFRFVKWRNRLLLSLSRQTWECGGVFLRHWRLCTFRTDACFDFRAIAPSQSFLPAAHVMMFSVTVKRPWPNSYGCPGTPRPGAGMKGGRRGRGGREGGQKLHFLSLGQVKSTFSNLHILFSAKTESGGWFGSEPGSRIPDIGGKLDSFSPLSVEMKKWPLSKGLMTRERFRPARSCQPGPYFAAISRQPEKMQKFGIHDPAPTPRFRSRARLSPSNPLFRLRLKNQPLCLKSGHFLTGFEWAGRCSTKSHVRLKISKCNLFKIAKIPRFVSTCVSFFLKFNIWLFFVVAAKCHRMNRTQRSKIASDNGIGRG